MSAPAAHQQYRIVFRGQALPGRRIEEVRLRAARRLQLPDEELEILFSGRKVFLKRRLGADDTKSYVRELLNVGMHVRIEREDGTLASPVTRTGAAARTAVASFDPERAESYTATQLDGVLAAYVPASSDHAASEEGVFVATPSLAPVAAPTDTSLPRHGFMRDAATANAGTGRPTPLLDEPAAGGHEAASEALPEIPPAAPQPVPSLADLYARQQRKRAKRLARIKAENRRTEPLLVALGIGVLALGWLLFA